MREEGVEAGRLFYTLNPISLLSNKIEGIGALRALL
jgi:hypothetical protein